jgi:hypothetical protein
MNKQEIETLVLLRKKLIDEFTSLRDYKNNKNAIMKEIECAKILHYAIIELDKSLLGNVEFKPAK